MEKKITNSEEKKFSKASIMTYLYTKSICGCIDSYNLSTLLGTISQRMIRNHTKAGNLKPIDNASSMYVYKCEDVAEWLMRFPRYLFPKVDNSDITEERASQLTNYIRIMVSNSFKPLLKKMSMDDIVGEAMVIILRKKRSANVKDYTMVYRALCSIWSKMKRAVETVSFENMDQIASDSDYDDGFGSVSDIHENI